MFINKKLKVLFALFSALLIMILTCGCVDMYANKRPTCYPNTKWISNNPNIYFQVISDENFGNIGEFNINNKVITIKMVFDYGPGVKIVDNNIIEKINNSTEAALITGHCKFSKTKLIVTIDEVSDKISLDPSIKEITFIRENLSKTSGS